MSLNIYIHVYKNEWKFYNYLFTLLAFQISARYKNNALKKKYKNNKKENYNKCKLPTSSKNLISCHSQKEKKKEKHTPYSNGGDDKRQ